MLFQKVVDWADTGWLYQCADVVQESKKVLPRSEVLLYSLQGGSLTQREQGWHERVALFSAFGLSDGVCFAGCITPHILGGFGVEKPDEGQALVGIRHGVEASQHTVSGDGVVCPDAIDREDCQVGIGLGRDGDAVHNGLCGEQARWIGEAKCWAMLRDTTLRRMSPMTIPRTRPFGFCNATMRPELLRNLDKCVCAAFVIQ